MSKYANDGEYIAMAWDYGPAKHEYVKGHVTPEQAKKVIEPEKLDDRHLDYWMVRWRWARWVPAPDSSEYDMRLQLCNEQGRGTFPITEVPYAV